MINNLNSWVKRAHLSNEGEPCCCFEGCKSEHLCLEWMAGFES